MIDLQKIREKVQVLLETETEESLTNWLMNKRNRQLKETLGKGTFSGISQCSTVFATSTMIMIEMEEPTVYDYSDDNLLAA